MNSMSLKPRILLEGAAQKLEGSLLHIKRPIDISLNEAVTVTGKDGRSRIGRIATVD